MKLSLVEQETIILFNKGEEMASIFTYESSWQRRLEERLGLKPVEDNGSGGKTYELPKKVIKPPRARRVVSEENRARMKARLQNARIRSQNSSAESVERRAG